MRTIRKLTIRGPGSSQLTTRPAVMPGPGELLIAPAAVGICATDLEILDGTLVYLRTGAASFPIVPGHEWTGTVIDIGPGVTNFAPGDRVVGECSIGCDGCEKCGYGDYHQCESRRETGILNLDGALADQMVFPARAAHRIAAHVEVMDAVLIEPLAVAFRAAMRLPLKREDNVLVVGGGTVGILTAMVLDACYGATAAIADPRSDRRERAARLGAAAHIEGQTYPFVVEATGAPSGIQTALSALSTGGFLVMVGLTGEPSVPLATDEVVVKDQTLRGSLGSPGVWPAVIELVEHGTVRPSRLITHEFPLDHHADAFACVRQARTGTGKVIIRPDGVVSDDA